MAIGAEQLKIPFVGRPVLEPPRPSILPILGAKFLAWVYVVNIQRAEIGEAAFNAFAPEPKNESELALPVARALVDAMPVPVPEVAHACGGAKPVRALLSAALALSVLSPPVGEVARLSAKLRPLVLGDRVPAMFASIHGFIIPKYFDIACERIENAQRQQRMFA